GSGGEMVRKIGELSRRAIEEVTGQGVYLDLWVKVVPGWRRNPAALRRLGYA
ncbi:MAG: KH domain-containing protein, partial [Synergistaceae bacterium]|nr:KH domain-containing protein [Synergistaceae bacterium]